ncbi:hypothetical protein ACWGNF_24785 [Streptomyces sp. NPDC055808]
MIQPVANGLRTDHPVPGLPFINDERLLLDNPDAIERTGRNQGEGLWGRADRLPGGGWVAFTTETKNRVFAWAVHQHPEHGRTVLLIRDRDLSGLHHEWMYGHNGFLYRHGGYWWDGADWYRPQQIVDRAYEGYVARPVAGAVTALDFLARPATSHTARVEKIAHFTAAEGPLPHWREHLALWASHRKPASRPLDQCVVDIQAPELDPGHFVDRAGLAQIAELTPKDLPHPKYGRRDLPPPQAESDEGPRWSRPVARDWAEQYHRVHGPEKLLSATTRFGTDQPQGLVDDHNRLTTIIIDSLQDATADGKKNRLFTRSSTPNHEEQAAHLAWWPAVAINDGTDGFIPIAAVRTTIVEAVLGGFARDVADSDAPTPALLGDIRGDVVHLIGWYIQREPQHTPALFGEICLDARMRFDLDPKDVGDLLRRSLNLDSTIDSRTLNALLDLALPPSAQSREGQ